MADATQGKSDWTVVRSRDRNPSDNARSGRVRRILQRGWPSLCLALLSTACLPNAGAASPKQQCPKAGAPEPSSTAEARSHFEEPPIPDVIPALPPREDQPATPPTENPSEEGPLDYPPPDLLPSEPAAPEPAAAETRAANHASSMGSEGSPSTPDVIPALPEIMLVPTPVGHGLLAIDAQQLPYRVRVSREYVICGDEHVSQIQICVTEDGTVSDVKILRPSIPAIDLQLPKVLALWKYRPYLVDGRPTAFCYPMNHRVR
jgi:hypothetical protein